MKILRIAKDSKEVHVDSAKFVGLYISKELSTKLTLLSIAEGTSKSVLLRELLTEELAPKDLITMLAKRLQNLYEMKSMPWSTFNVNTFKVYAQSELLKRGLEDSLVEQILKKFDKIMSSKK